MHQVNINNVKFSFTKKAVKENLILSHLQKIFKDITFLACNQATITQSFSTHSEKNNIRIVFIGTKGATKKKLSTVALHEVGHILKPNKHFLLAEQIAWVYAKNASEKYKIPFDETFMVECFDAYKRHYETFRGLLLTKFKDSMPLVSVEKLDNLICSAMKNHIKNEYKIGKLKLKGITKNATSNN